MAPPGHTAGKREKAEEQGRAAGLCAQRTRDKSRLCVFAKLREAVSRMCDEEKEGSDHLWLERLVGGAREGLVDQVRGVDLTL